MPKGELHQRRGAKNWVLMGALCGFALLVFAVTILKMTVQP